MVAMKTATETKRFEVRFAGVAREIVAESHRDAAMSVVRAELGADAQVAPAGLWDSTGVNRWQTIATRPRLVLTREIAA